jgi:hypothetical protein
MIIIIQSCLGNIIYMCENVGLHGISQIMCDNVVYSISEII